MPSSSGEPPPDRPPRIKYDHANAMRMRKLMEFFGRDPHSFPAWLREALDVLRGRDAETFVERFAALLCDPEGDVSGSALYVVRLYWRKFFADEALFLRSLFPRLIEVIDTGSPPGAKLHAVQALNALGSPHVTEPVPLLIRLIQDSHQQEDVREAAIRALPSFGPDAASMSIPTLVRALEGGTVGIRLAACSTLRWLGIEAGPAVRPLVAAVLKDADGAVRREAALALIQIDPEGRIVGKALPKRSARERFVGELVAIGEEARPLRHRLIEQTDENVSPERGGGAADSGGQPADSEVIPGDSGADISPKKKKKLLPRNANVTELIRRIDHEKDKGSGRSRIELALELTDGCRKTAETLRRQAHRFKHLHGG